MPESDMERAAAERALTEPEKAALWFERARKHSQRADRAEAEVERLREALERIAYHEPPCDEVAAAMREIAREAIDA